MSVGVIARPACETKNRVAATATGVPRGDGQADRPLDLASWDRRYSQAELVWSATPNQFFAEEVAAFAPERALDLGTGEGRNAVWLGERGWDTTAVDFSATGIEDRSNLIVGVGGPQDPSILFTPEEIVSDLAVLDIVRSQRVVRHVQTPHGERDAIDALVFALAPGAA